MLHGEGRVAGEVAHAVGIGIHFEEEPIHIPGRRGVLLWRLGWNFPWRNDRVVVHHLRTSNMKNLQAFLLTLCFPLALAAENPTIDLLADGLDNWTLGKKGAWKLEDGVLSPSDEPGGYVWTKESYGDFELSLEYKTSEKCNSGVFFRTDPKNPVQGGFEIQVASPGLYNGKNVVGALYDAKAPSKAAAKPDGEWNRMVLTCRGAKVMVQLNGETVLEADLDQWTTANKNPDGSRNKFKTALKDLPRTGHIGFQYHGHPVWFRDVTVKAL